MKKNQPSRGVIVLTIGIGVLALMFALTRQREHTRSRSEISASDRSPNVRTMRKAILAPKSETAPAKKAGNLKLYTQPDDGSSWAVAYGREFWKRAISEPVPPWNGTTALGANLDLGDVIDRVRHPILWGDSEPHPRIQSRTYAAFFDGNGFKFSPHSEPFKPNPSVEVTFRTLKVASGDHVFYRHGENVSWSFLGNTAQGLLNAGAGVVEHYETTSDGVEVTWVLNQRPAGPGPLQIEAELSGLSHAGQDEHGHHFADTDGTRHVQVSHAVLVDFEGKRLDVPILANGNTLRLEIAESTLGNLGFPIAIDPTVSPELAMTYCFPPNAQKVPAIAWNGTNYFVAWTDERNVSPGGPADIYGTRITPAGKVMDPLGIGVATSSDSEAFPRVASDGSNFFVVWEQLGSSSDIYGARVRWDGVVVDTTPIGISTGTLHEFLPDVACQGTNYLVVWEDRRNHGINQTDIYGARVTTAGGVVDTAGIQIQTNEWGLVRPAVASDGTNYLVIWQTPNPAEIYAARVTSAGSVLDSTGVLISSNAAVGGIAYAKAANNYLVAFTGGTTIFDTGPYANRVTTSGGIQTLDGNGDLLKVGGGDPAVASNGTNYLVAFLDLYGLFGFRVRASDGAVLDGNPIPIREARGDGQSQQRVASNGTDFFVTWADGLGDPHHLGDIFGARVTAAGEVPDNLPLSINQSEDFSQRYPAIVQGAQSYFLAWEDDRNVANNSVDIYGTRVRSDGVPKDPCGILICTNSALQERPGVAVSTREGDQFLVVWGDKRSGNFDLYAARVTNGIVLETNGFAVSTATGDQQYPTAYSLAGEYFVTWQNYTATSYIDIYGARVTYGGTVVDTTPILITGATLAQRFPRISGMESNYFVVWFDNRYNTGYDIFGARVHTNGTVVDTAGVAIHVASSYDYYPDIANDGDNYLVVWQHLIGGSSQSWEIYGTRVSKTGTVLDSPHLNICTVTNAQQFPAVAYRSEFLVAWADDRVTAGTSDIYAARISSAGTVLDSNGFLVDAHPNNQTYPAVAGAPDIGNTYLVLFHSGKLNSTTPRIKGRVIKTP